MTGKLGTKKSRRILIMLTIAAILMIGISNITCAPENSNKMEAAAGKYIEALANKDFIEIRKMDLKSFGLDPAYFSSLLIPSDEAEKKGLLQELSEVIRSDSEIDELLAAQYDSVINSFGKDAWDNVSFELSKVEHLNGTITFVERETKKQITEEQYETLNQSYWETVAKANGITAEQLFGFDNPELDRESAYQLHSLFLKNLEKVPADTVVVPDYELYRVSLSFDGKTVGADGLENYRFYLSNQSGTWKVKEGLTWDYPLSGPSDEEY